MKGVRSLIFRVLLLITFTTAYLCFLYGQERQHSDSIVRNAVWNDLVRQMDPLTDDSPQETWGKEIVLIQKFLREHQSEVSVGIYDIAVFRAIDQARAPLAEGRQGLGNDQERVVLQRIPSEGWEVTPWNAKQSSVAAIVGSRFSRARTLPDSRFQAEASTSAFIDDSIRETVGKGA
jgi:hypothetical protein